VQNSLDAANERYVTGLKSGDLRIFEEIYRKYYPVLYRYAVSITKTGDSAEDAINETFLKLWEGRDRIVINISLQAYLFKSVYNYCINALKHIQIREKYKSVFAGHLPMDENDRDYPLSGLIEEEIGSIVQKVVDQLPEQCRHVFVMSRFEHMKYEEIASALNISVHTVHTHIKRALGKLRAGLADFLSVLIGI
jgi:RNA polymerase sigma-70 factor (ECF subfamily)